MKKNFKVFLTVLFILVTVFSLSACKDEPEEEPIVYDIPIEVSIDIYKGGEFIGKISNAVLLKVQQTVITMTTTNSAGTTTTKNYVVYNMASIISAMEKSIVGITKVKVTATDDYSSEFNMTSFANAFISIGLIEEDVFVKDNNAPRFISDKHSASSKSVASLCSVITINPLPKTE